MKLKRSTRISVYKATELAKLAEVLAKLAEDGGVGGPREPRTQTGKRPSPRALQRSLDYEAWLERLPEPEGDVVRDDSWATFMKERETARLRERAVQRFRERQDQRHERHAADLEDSTAVKQPKKRGRPVDPNSKRQQRLARGPSERKLGRPIDETSKRQLKLAARALLRKQETNDAAVRAEEQRSRRRLHVQSQRRMDC